MKDCHSDIAAYHNDEVRLSKNEMESMRGRQSSNQDRLKSRLDGTNKPKIREIVTQGSFAMKTMVQHPDNDYDIDDGVYFDVEDLNEEANDAEMAPHKAREMVRDAAFDSSFKKKPQARKKCVRVHYNDGSHIDVPVYRRVKKIGSNDLVCEIAIEDEWTQSDARDVTEWFVKANKNKSPNTSRGGQMRRIVQLLKKFAKERKSSSDEMLSGFCITILVEECYIAHDRRDDQALYETIVAIRGRLRRDLVIMHPLMDGVEVDDGSGHEKAKAFLDELAGAIKDLEPLLAYDCTREKALECWDKFFGSDFFEGRVNINACTESVDTSPSSPAVLRGKDPAEVSRNLEQPVQKRGPNRYG